MAVILKLSMAKNYPEKHEEGDGVPSRPVFDLILVGGRLDENIDKLTEKWGARGDRGSGKEIFLT